MNMLPTLQFILQISARVILKLQPDHVTLPLPPPFQTLHQHSTAVKYEFTVLTLLEDST